MKIAMSARHVSADVVYEAPGTENVPLGLQTNTGTFMLLSRTMNVSGE
jgi:hypothetical protein